MYVFEGETITNVNERISVIFFFFGLHPKMFITFREEKTKRQKQRQRQRERQRERKGNMNVKKKHQLLSPECVANGD